MNNYNLFIFKASLPARMPDLPELKGRMEYLQKTIEKERMLHPETRHDDSVVSNKIIA